MAAPPLDVICNVNANPTPLHTTASWGGIFWTNYDSGADDEPCRLIAAAPTLAQRRWFVVDLFASVCTHDNNDKPRRLVVALSASVHTHDDNDKPTWLVVIAPVFN